TNHVTSHSHSACSKTSRTSCLRELTRNTKDGQLDFPSLSSINEPATTCHSGLPGEPPTSNSRELLYSTTLPF
ncbi:hypothetical protein FRC02_005918, partial [Tulasnella sp. 418]